MSTTQAPRRNAAVATQAPSAVPQDKRPATAKIGPESAFGAAVKNRGVLGVGGMLALQAAAGNRAVAGLVQAKPEPAAGEGRAASTPAPVDGHPGSGNPMPPGPVQAKSAVNTRYGDLVAAARAPTPRVPDATGMPALVRAKMEGVLGADFSEVRVHPGSARAEELGALAFTQGSEIHVASGQWAPETTKGQELLGHELGHVLQQRAGRVSATAQLKGVGLNDEPALEAEADAMGARAARGDAAQERAPFARGHVADTAARGRQPQAVVQRLVPLGLKTGTAVVIVRSTSRELHGNTATIMGVGEKANEYLVRVDTTGEEVYARADQLKLTTDRSSTAAPTDVDLSFLEGGSVDEILELVKKKVVSALPEAVPFIVGGSFAAFLHAAKVGQEARTPRDIDLLVPQAVWKDKFGGDSRTGAPVRTNVSFFGIPFEIHRIGTHVKETDLQGHVEKSTGEVSMLDKNLLLMKNFLKLKKQSPYYFGPYIDFKKPAAQNLQSMQAANNELMKLPDTDLSSNSKGVWMKTLVDIESLIKAGAVLPSAAKSEG